MKRREYGLRCGEMALLVGVAMALLVGVWLSGQHNALSENLIRLHVIGASNSTTDQEIKLQVRDAILAEATPFLEGATSVEEAKKILAEHLSDLAQAGAEVAQGATVTAMLEDRVWFPTKEYTDFSLPAGRYSALRIVIGEGEGRNWWCVVFPPLCMGSVSEVAQEAGNFTSDQIRLITGKSEGYLIKFRLLELWNRLIFSVSD